MAAAAEGDCTDAVMAARAESRAFAESIRSEEERRARRLYEEQEETRQLAAALQLSAAHAGFWEKEEQRIFFAICEEVGVAPGDIQMPTPTPRASDRAEELAFAATCHKKGIKVDGGRRHEAKLESLREARAEAEARMQVMLGPGWREDVERRLEWRREVFESERERRPPLLPPRPAPSPPPLVGRG